MPRPIIDKTKLSQMLTQGKTLTECAEYFGVSVASVSKARRKMKINVVKAVQLKEASRVVSQHLNVVDQLSKINSDAHQILSDAMSVCSDKANAHIIGPGAKDPRDIAMKAMRRVEAQIELQNKTLALLTDMTETLEFQQELIDLLNDVDPELKDEFLRRLKERRALYQAIRLS